MSCCNHNIEISSLKDNETVINEIILLKGTIKSPCDENQIKIIVNGREKFGKVDFSKFKSLIILEDRINNVDVIYCNEKHSLVVEYSREKQSDYKVAPLWIIFSGHDGNFQTTQDDSQNTPDIACQKLNLSLKLIQCVISEKLVEAGFLRKSFILEDCEIYHSDLNVESVRNLNDFELYDRIALEILERKGSDSSQKTKYVGLLSCTYFEGIYDGDSSYKNIKSKVWADPSLGGNFLCLLGSGCLYSWPTCLDDVITAFKNDRIVDISQVLDDSNYRHTYGGCYSTTLGSLCHELCHTFDLGHTVNGIMGKHFDFIGRFFLTKFTTENLPERQVMKCQKAESFVPMNPHHQKLTKIKNNGQQFLQKYHQQKNNDLTFFEQNCYITLNYHKWFNSVNPESNILFEKNERTVHTFHSYLKLVEIRDLENAMLIKYWSFLNLNVTSFKIPPKVELENVTLFAINDCGGLLKENL